MFANKEDDAELEARDALNGEGFQVRRIERRATQTADFFVSDGADSYLIEVKSIQKKDAFLPLIAAEARKKGVAYDWRIAKYENRLDRFVCEKAKQLDATMERAKFSVLWISVPPEDWEWLHQQMLRTLYGIARLFAWRNSREQATSHDCFYYHLFSFYRTRNLDAVVLANGTGGRLMVNDLSPHVTQFRATRLYGMFHDHMTDPGVVPRDCGIFFVDPLLDRRSERAVWTHLRERYGLMTWESQKSEFRGVLSLADLFEDEDNDGAGEPVRTDKGDPDGPAGGG